MFSPKEIIFAPKKGAQSLRLSCHPSHAQVDTKLGNVVPRSLLRSVEAPTRNRWGVVSTSFALNREGGE